MTVGFDPYKMDLSMHPPGVAEKVGLMIEGGQKAATDEGFDHHFYYIDSVDCKHIIKTF